MGWARVPGRSDCPSSCADPGLSSRPSGLYWVAQPVPRGAKVPAGPSSGGNREHPGHIQQAASTAVEQSTGSHSTVTPTDAASTSTPLPDSQKGIGSGVCGSSVCQGACCLLELMAIVAGGALIFMLCSIGIWYCWKRKRQLLEEKLKAGGWSRDVYSQKSLSSSSESDQFVFAPPSSVVL